MPCQPRGITMKKTDIIRCKRSVQFHEFAIESCEKVRVYILQHGPGKHGDDLVYISPTDNNARDPVAIICPNWNIKEGTAVAQESQVIDKAIKRACRALFPSDQTPPYEMFREFMAQLQDAHDDSFVIVKDDEYDACMEEFGFRIRELIKHHSNLRDIALQCLTKY